MMMEKCSQNERVGRIRARERERERRGRYFSHSLVWMVGPVGVVEGDKSRVKLAASQNSLKVLDL